MKNIESCVVLRFHSSLLPRVGTFSVSKRVKNVHKNFSSKTKAYCCDDLPIFHISCLLYDGMQVLWVHITLLHVLMGSLHGERDKGFLLLELCCRRWRMLLFSLSFENCNPQIVQLAISNSTLLLFLLIK